jgi:hypothetical protein
MILKFKEDEQLKSKLESLIKYVNSFEKLDMSRVQLTMCDHNIVFQYDDIYYEIKKCDVTEGNVYVEKEQYALVYYFTYETLKEVTEVNITNITTFDNIITAWDYAEEGIIELIANEHRHDDDEEEWPEEDPYANESIIPDQYEAMDQDIF